MGKKRAKRGKTPRRSGRKPGTGSGSSGRGPRATDSSPLSRLGDKGGGGFRVPAFTVVPACAGVGYFINGWVGAVICGAIGIFLWRMRA
jgi:hypothetical protein